VSVIRRSHSREFKIDICERIQLGQLSKAAACREYSLAPSMLDRWCGKYAQKGQAGFSADTPESLELRVKQLEASLGRAHLENDFLKQALGKLGLQVKRQP
jgi:transposase-like protein